MARARRYRLDNGPTVLTMPDLLADAFAAAGADMADHVTLRPVDPMYRAVLRRRLASSASGTGARR